MYKKILIICFLLLFILIGSITSAFIYSDQTQKVILNFFSIKKLINQKTQFFISKQINDKTLRVNLTEVIFLEPNWPNIVRVKIKDINIKSNDQLMNSNIKTIELGMSFMNLFKNLILDEKLIIFNYIDIKDITLNGTIEKKQFDPGPIMSALLAINNNYLEKTIKKNNIQQLLQKNISLGNIKFKLLDKRNHLEKKMIDFNCNDVLITKRKKKYRTISLKCEDSFNSKFSIEGKLSSNQNFFEGFVENFNPEVLLGSPLAYKINNKTIKFLNRLNGVYSFITNKTLKVEEFKFKSYDSILKVKSLNENILKNDVIINGEVAWTKRNDDLVFSQLSFNNLIVGDGKINTKNRKGIIRLKLEKSSLSSLNIFIDQYYHRLNRILNIDGIFNNYPIKKYFKEIKQGALNNVNININFMLTNDYQKFYIEKIRGSSDLSNLSVHHKNEFFKSHLNNVSGSLDFELKPNNSGFLIKSDWIQLALKASNGYILQKNTMSAYKFDKFDINVKISNDSAIIYQANFYKNSNLDYSFKDIKVTEDLFIDGYLEIKSNNKSLYKFQKETDIQFPQISDLLFKIKGNINNMNLQLDFNGDLSNSSFGIPFLNVKKKKNTQSSIKFKVFLENGKFKSLNDFILKIKNKAFKVDSITFDHIRKNTVFLKNIITPFLNLEEINITNINDYINIEAFGKSLNLTNFRKQIENDKFNTKNILNFDVTANKIILDSKISIAGNLKGTKKGNTLKAIGLGKMWIGNSPILDSGKLQILINNISSNIKSVGLIGGAETKIILNKNKKQLPTISFDTSDGGKLLSALNFTGKVRSGKMNINLRFLDNSYDHYEGKIKASDFSLVNTPGIINSLSILSFSGIESILTGEGVSFDSGEVEIYVKDNIFNFDPLLLTSSSLGIRARGRLNLDNQEINLIGSVAPIKIISQIISVVPAVGELITGLKKDGLFAGQFKMIGPVNDPKVSLNALSFAPGILREIFSKNWLDKDSFFVKNKSN